MNLPWLSASLLISILRASLPCIFVMRVVPSASLQSEAPGKSVFRDLVVSLSPGIVYFMMPYVHAVS